MRRYFIGLLRSFVIMLFVLALAVINTNAKTDSLKNFVIQNEYNDEIIEKLEDKEEIINKQEEKEEYKPEKIEDIPMKKEEPVKKEEPKAKENTKVVKTSSTNNTVQNNSHKETNTVKYGTYGRIYISGYSAALYDYNVYTRSSESLQTLVDNSDSAAYYLNYGKKIIADHAYQGFNVLINLSEGATSYIKFEDGSVIRYKLIKKSEGVNTGPDLIDNEGNSFFDMASDLIMYTCYGDGIMATLWVLA